MFKNLICLTIASATMVVQSADISPNELKGFARRVETSVIQDKGKLIDQSLDKEFFGARCTRGGGTQKLKDLFLKGFFSAFKYGSAISKAAKTGHYKMVRCYKKGSKNHIIFRMVSNNALNYHDYWVVKNKKGEFKIVDCYVYTTGENLSDTMNRMFIQWNASMDPSFLTRLMKKNKHFKENMKTFADMSKATRANKPKEAIKFYKKLSAKFQKMKMAMLIACKNYALIDQSAYFDKMKEYKELFPGDPSLPLMLIDYYFLKKDYQNTLKSIDELDANLGKDPYLNLYRAYVYKQQNKLKETQKYAAKVIATLPSLSEPYLTFLSASLAARDFAAVTKCLKLLRKNGFDISRKNILEDPEYKDYVKSKEFKILKLR